MELGQYIRDVLEFVEFVESGGIFRNPRPPLGTVKIIHDMAEVGDYLHVIADYEGDDGMDWREVLEYGGEPGSDVVGEVRKRIKSVPGLMEGLAELADGRINQAMKRHLGNRYTEDDIMYIWCTVDFILGFRSTYGRTLPFIEQLVEIFCLGGFPCGWVGRYPQGQIVAYFPPSDGPDSEKLEWVTPGSRKGDIQPVPTMT